MTSVGDGFQSVGIDDVISKLQQAVFGKPLITNVLRGQLVEAMIALALEPQWTWCSADFASWDFERSDGVRLEVKQSALRQTWTSSPSTKSSPSFDVRPRTGYWDGGTFIDQPGRVAHLYIFALHSQIDERTDHRDPQQWQFYVVRSADLPAVARIALGSVKRITDSVPFDELLSKVEDVSARL